MLEQNLLYIDPAATTALVSSITVIIAALGAALIIFWRNFKKKLFNTLHLDENKGKEVEEDLIITDEAIKELALTLEAEAENEVPVKKEKTITVRCLKCRKKISGVKNSAIVCEFCGEEQILEEIEQDY